MPDFTFITVSQCETLEEEWAKSYNGKYTLTKWGDDWDDWDCTCPAYQYSKPEAKGCKHVRHYLANRCTWHSEFGYPQTEEQKTRQVCPGCGKPTVYRQFAV